MAPLLECGPRGHLAPRPYCWPALTKTFLPTCTVRPAGEHTVIMLRPLRSPDVADTAWLAPFVTDFRGRFMQLLSGALRRTQAHLIAPDSSLLHAVRPASFTLLEPQP